MYGLLFVVEGSAQVIPGSSPGQALTWQSTKNAKL